MTPRFAIKSFEALTRRELHDIFWLRNVVFVVGQKITSEPEIDGRDPAFHHAMLWQAGPGGKERLVGTTRIFTGLDPMVVGRVAVHTELQGQGLGTVMMERVQAFLGGRAATLHAQAHLEAWYARLGWVRRGDVFVEAEIPHVTMDWPAPGSTS